MMPLELSNAPTVFMDLMNQVLCEYLDRFIIIFINDILIYSPNVEKRMGHLTLVLQRFREEQLYAKFSKFEFWLTQIGFQWIQIRLKQLWIGQAR